MAECLENIQYKGIKRWNMVMLCFWMFFCGRYVDLKAVVKSWVPFAAIMVLIALFRL